MTMYQARLTNKEISVIAQAVHNRDTTSGNLETGTAKTIQVIVNVSAIDVGVSLAVSLLGVQIDGETFSLIPAPAPIGAIGLFVYELGPGNAASGGVTSRTAGAVPELINVTVTHIGAGNATYGVSISFGV